MRIACANTIDSDQFANPVGLKKSICGSHTLCVDHEESLGTKQRLRKYTTHFEPLIELSNQRKHEEHVYFYFNSKLIEARNRCYLPSDVTNIRYRFLKPKITRNKVSEEENN